jgi:hypothetical protein
LNAGIRDQQVKLKQRLSVFIALKRYEQAANGELASSVDDY